ncbi:MAG: FKBP-type peptidyl-prolyl cis-trans isomerase [Proteobacteria bacterium]|nr:FKBP-type peptidyl-prolyl cis-trans isomerase [Pseudomonadota bacterium]
MLSLSAAAAVTTTTTAPAAPLDVNQASFSAGLSFGAQLRAAGLANSLSMDSLKRGIEAGVGGTPMSATDQQRLSTWVHGARAQLAQTNKATGTEFLARNGKAAGVVTTSSGLQYRVVKSGDTKAASPQANDQVTVNYRGLLLDGREFDSSYKRGQPATFSVGGVIKGWSEALQLMKPGAAWEIYVPAALAYGANPPPGTGIGPESTLKFELELLKVTAPPALSNSPGAGGIHHDTSMVRHVGGTDKR